MENPLTNKAADSFPFPKDEHFPRARYLLAQELRTYYDHRIMDEDLTPEFDLPKECQGDSCNVVFGFSLGEGLAKKVFSIRFQMDRYGEPIFDLESIADPSLRRLRLTGQLSTFDKGRCQIERVLAGGRKLMN